MEELISSGLPGMEDASATRKQREEKMKDVRRENQDEDINSTPPPCPLPPPPPETVTQEEEEEEQEVYREEGRIARYRGLWESRFAGKFGSFDDQTSLGPMRFTSGPIPSYARPHCTMQIFNIPVADLEDGVKWPLHVHGLVAARDTSDHNHNFLFNRTEDNCQILTQEAYTMHHLFLSDPYLLLTGPSRAIVIIDPIMIEFQLKVKSKTDHEEDEMLAFGIFNYPQTYLATHVIHSGILCDRCTIELAYTPLDPSVEATVIGVRIIDGVWPEGFRGRIVAEVTTMREGEVLLLDSRDGKMPISPSTGAVELSRHVVSIAGKEDGDEGGGAAIVVARGKAMFAPERAGTSNGTCDLGFCKVEVAVAWSLVSSLWNERRALAKLAEERS
ncbi:hypothetical protein CFC21_026451 [Triticum aestivum]|uniref:DUF6598 domain-containing protein n=2 Tax=Triticum aestivum TaxID=4565 RepID=A0A9R1EKM3_WHEAT|nr:hypothetical protein CFC21_026451 [Triticum aestivum]